MIRTISLVAALLGVLFFAAPAFAQTDEARPGEKVTLTFRLAVEGDVPGWQHFVVEYYPAGGQPGRVPLCTTAADEGPAGPRCVGGDSYSASANVPAGNPVTVRFLRHDTRTAPEFFKEATRAYDTNSAIDARYDFPGASPDPTPADEPDNTTETAAHDQYASDGETSATPSTGPGDAVPGVATGVTSTSTPASIASDPQTAAPTTSASATPTASASASASATPTASASLSAKAAADTSKPVMRVLPDTGGAGALPALGLLLVILGAGSAFRKVL